MNSHIATRNDEIASIIYLVRGQRVMLDADLAVLYQVPTKRLNEQLRRNKVRFPEDFAFQLTHLEATNLRSQIATSSSPLEGSAPILKSQIATSSSGWGGRRKLPWVFTEHGTVMLASVLNSPVAVQTSIQVVRAFVQLRGLLAGHADLARKIDRLEAKYDESFRQVFAAIRGLMEPPPVPRRRIGFRAG